MLETAGFAFVLIFQKGTIICEIHSCLSDDGNVLLIVSAKPLSILGKWRHLLVLTLMTIRSPAAPRAFIASIMGTSHGHLGPGLGMVLRAWMRFSSHLAVSASEYSCCYPDLTHGKPPRRISYDLTY